MHDPRIYRSGLLAVYVDDARAFILALSSNTRAQRNKKEMSKRSGIQQGVTYILAGHDMRALCLRVERNHAEMRLTTDSHWAKPYRVMLNGKAINKTAQYDVVRPVGWEDIT